MLAVKSYKTWQGCCKNLSPLLIGRTFFLTCDSTSVSSQSTCPSPYRLKTVLTTKTASNSFVRFKLCLLPIYLEIFYIVIERRKSYIFLLHRASLAVFVILVQFLLIHHKPKEGLTQTLCNQCL